MGRESNRSGDNFDFSSEGCAQKRNFIDKSDPDHYPDLISNRNFGDLLARFLTFSNNNNYLYGKSSQEIRSCFGRIGNL